MRLLERFRSPPLTRAGFAIAGAVAAAQLHREVLQLASTASAAADPGRPHRLLEQELTMLRRENTRLQQAVDASTRLHDERDTIERSRL